MRSSGVFSVNLLLVVAMQMKEQAVARESLPWFLIEAVKAVMTGGRVLVRTVPPRSGRDVPP